MKVYKFYAFLQVEREHISSILEMCHYLNGMIWEATPGLELSSWCGSPKLLSSRYDATRGVRFTYCNNHWYNLEAQDSILFGKVMIDPEILLIKIT